MSVNSLKALQLAVEGSKTEHQRRSNISERALFLGTEIGEAQKEVLKHFGLYGLEAKEGAKGRLAKELCDVIWNVCDLANMLELQLDEPMQVMLEQNAKRVWVGTGSKE